MSENDAPTSRAQWVVPRPRPSSRDNSRTRRGNKYTGAPSKPQSHQDASSQPALSSSSIITANTYTYDNSIQQRLTQSEHIHEQNTNQIDEAICRTICVIVAQYLSELREHQKQINLARSKQVRDGPSHSSAEDGSYIALNDVNRLRVRDEQTKAIETIKQLTMYLKELSTIKRHESNDVDLVKEAIHDKLSDLRNEIIHTLNDFVLANSDIDIPIVDLDDPTGGGRDYDLCIEAHRSNRDIRQIEVTPSPSDQGGDQSENSIRKRINTTSHEPVRRPLASRSNNVTAGQSSPDQTPEKTAMEMSVDYDDKYKLMTIHDDYQLIELDKRKREIHKLEKDTVELRNLFADFYNFVKLQSEQVDSIENNLVVAAQQISEARNHLQPRHVRGLAILLPMTGCITGALIGGPIGFFVGGKLGGVTIICATSLLGLLSSFGAQKCIDTNRSK